MDNKPPFITAFIELYRQYPCLWKVKDDTYANKRLKDEAYGILLDFYKKTVLSATVDTVKKKINNLRSSFRKELKKVKNSKSGSSADDSYIPSLWYYELLLFSADQEASRITVDSDEPIFDNQEESLTFNQSRPPSPLPLPTPPLDSSDKESVSSFHSSSSKKSKISINENTKRSINTALRALKDDDEYDGIGINVACKLRRMDEEQKLHAEMLISKVLLHGMKGRLQEETIVTGLKFLRPETPVHHKVLSPCAGKPDSQLQPESKKPHSESGLPLEESNLQCIPVQYVLEDTQNDYDGVLSQFLVIK